MPFEEEMLIAFIVGCTIGLTILFYLRNKYKKENRVVRNLGFKVGAAVVMLLVTIVVLFRRELSFMKKIEVIVGTYIAVVVYVFFMISARNALKKASGDADKSIKKKGKDE
ncbi:MAG: hypothetical protein M0Z52_04020 [Actinomycetota bacterium]|nr:hypothetical protein [Actinomycetota bacterium]